MQRVPDPYRVLGVGREATSAEVKAAHRRLAKRYHPDAPHADATRFLAVQDAYELLRDPLRRREWDRRHAPGPVRAEPTSDRPRRHRSGPPDATVTTEPPASPRSRRRRPMGSDATFGPNDRPADADRWTWTAEGVPWWEDGGSPGTRRTPRRRPSAGSDERAGASSTRGATGPSRQDRRDRPDDADPGVAARGRSSETEPGAEPRSDFDVFTRSSGAAWSSASRAYFRRRASDMPSGAANPDTPRWTTPVGAPMPRRYEPPTPATDPAPAARQPSDASRSLGATLAALFRRGDR